jgi:hypothetical protein
MPISGRTMSRSVISKTSSCYAFGNRGADVWPDLWEASQTPQLQMISVVWLS